MLGEPKMPMPSENQAEQEKPETKIFFIRHSKAMYATYAEKLASEEPETPIDLDNQIYDLPEAGEELAENSAREFLSTLDPSQDVLYLVSSSQNRAMHTALIYAQVAEAMGFEVVPHEPRRELINKAGESEGQGKVRVLESLSLHRKENAKNQLEMSIFNSVKTLPDINWSAIDEEKKARWEKARALVMADDKGNWGANFAAYAKLVSETVEGYEHIETPEKLYETQYQNLKRLAEFARNKDTGDKQVNVVSFGHENYMSVALAQDTGEESIANTEAVELTEDGLLKRLHE